MRRGANVIRDGSLPVIRREDIDWDGGRNGAPLFARFTFRNPTGDPTDAVVFWIGVADFGAFLPHRPVRTLVVPSIAPGASLTLTALVPGVQASRRGRVTRGQTDEEQVISQLATHVLHLEARGGLDGPALAQRLRQMVGETMSRAVLARLEERRKDLATALAPRGALNVAIMSPDREILGERHLCVTPLLGWVKRGEANPMSFWVRQRGDGLVMEVGEISEGWNARLEPGSFGDVVPDGEYRVWVTPPLDATEGALRVDVRCRTTGAVCPVEWRWEEGPLEEYRV